MPLVGNISMGSRSGVFWWGCSGTVDHQYSVLKWGSNWFTTASVGRPVRRSTRSEQRIDLEPGISRPRRSVARPAAAIVRHRLVRTSRDTELRE
mgnify:CR=1 FL=1